MAIPTSRFQRLKVLSCFADADGQALGSNWSDEDVIERLRELKSQDYDFLVSIPDGTKLR